MKWRVVLVVLLALAVGVAGGWAYAASQDDGDEDRGPVAAAIEPVPATPSLPVEVAEPDPDDPTLVANIQLKDTRLRLPVEGTPEYEVKLPVPAGWERGFDGDSKWTFTKPDNSDKTFGLRVQIIAGEDRNIESALRVRLDSLQSAVAQTNLRDLEFTVDQTGDGFTATYVDKDGYNRVTIERFFVGNDGNAFATVAAYGRYRDRTGLEDLIARIGIDLSTTEFSGAS